MSAGTQQQRTETTTIDVKGSIITRVVEWGLQRDPLASVCLGLLLAICWGLWHAGNNLIPQQIAAIQVGYEKLAGDYIADRKEMTAAYLADKDQLRKLHAAELDALGKRMESVVERFERVTAGQERLVRELIFHEQRTQRAEGPQQ